MKSPQAVAALWAKQMAGSTDKIKAGVESMRVNPMEEAAKAKDRMVEGVRKAVDNGTWEAGLASVSVADWKAKMVGKGIDRISAGARDAQPKMQKFLTEFLPVAEDISATVRSMPKGSTEDALQRVRVAIEKSKEFAARRAR